MSGWVRGASQRRDGCSRIYGGETWVLRPVILVDSRGEGLKAIGGMGEGNFAVPRFALHSGPTIL